MDSLKVSMDSGTMREGPIPNMSQPPPKAFVGTNNQEVPTSFYTSTRYTIWDSGCTHYINPYFEIYTQYKPLEKGYDAEVNGIGGLINTKGIGTFTLDLEYDTGKIHNII